MAWHHGRHQYQHGGMASCQLDCGKLGIDRRRRNCNLGNVVWNLRLAQTDRKGNRAAEGALIMDIVVALILVGVALLFVYIAFDATKHLK